MLKTKSIRKFFFDEKKTIQFQVEKKFHFKKDFFIFVLFVLVSLVSSFLRCSSWCMNLIGFISVECCVSRRKFHRKPCQKKAKINPSIVICFDEFLFGRFWLNNLLVFVAVAGAPHEHAADDDKSNNSEIRSTNTSIDV